MVDTVLKTKGQDTRIHCFNELKGLFAATDRKLSKLSTDKSSGTIIIEIHIEGGICSARIAKKREFRAIPGAIDPEILLPEILDRIEQMLLPDCYNDITIEIVSDRGALSAVETEIDRHRWDVRKN